MAFIILAALLVVGVAFYQVIQGLYSALIMAVLTILCAALAFCFYEPLAALLHSTPQAGYADGAALMALFVIPLIGLRFAFDQYLPGNVVLGVWADRIAGGALGLVTGIIVVGMTALSMQMLPFHASILTFQPFNDALQRNSGLAPFYGDQFVAAFGRTLSAGSLKGERRLGQIHPDMLRDAWCARNTAGKFGRTWCPPDALSRVQVYTPAEERLAPWRLDVPDNPLIAPGTIDEMIIVRCHVAASARDETTKEDKETRFRLPATHFRLLTDGGQSHYPVAYLTYGPGGWQAETAPVTDGQTQVGQLIVVRPHGTTPVAVDWVYRIPKGQKPLIMAFRRIARADCQIVEDEPLPPKGALDRQGDPGQRR